MKKTVLTLLMIFGFVAVPAAAEDLFWTYTDDQEPVVIPPECDGRFDEVRGGVFMPTAEEVYTNGMNFLNSNIESVQKQAPYCFLAAALEGHADAQLELARMYNEGKFLPQDDLSAYKWAFVAALNGNKAAEPFVLTLEQFLTTDDLESTSGAIQTTRIQIQEAQQKRMAAEREAMAADLNKLAQLQGGNAPKDGAAPKAGMVAPNALLNIFTEEDRFKR